MDSTQISARRQRPRPIRSCLQCRRMKAKCDRLLPCSRCVRIGASRECSYNDTRHPRHYTRPSETLANGSDAEHISTGHEASSPIQNRLLVDATKTANASNSFSNSEPTAAGVPPTTLIDLCSRVEKLEEVFQDLIEKELPDCETSAASSGFAVRLHPLKASGILDFKGLRSRYYSRTHWITLFRRFNEAVTIMQHVMKDPIVPPLIKEVQTLQKRAFAKRRKAANVETFREPTSTIAKLLDILPTQMLCEKLINIYFDTWESTFRVLHRPSFLDTLHAFWDLPLEGKIKLHGLIPQLVAVLAVACSTTSGILAGSISDSAWSNMACDSLNFWLFGLPRKDQNEMSTLQTSCLLVLAMQLNMYPPDKIWNATGSLVRSAMSMGLHIDPEPFDLSRLQKEIRRRLWSTILEFDLQASQAVGMAPYVHADTFTSETPANLTDSDLRTVHNVPQRDSPVDISTDISPQHVLASSLRLRLEIASLLGRAELQKQDIQNLLRKRELIEEAIHSISPTLRIEQSTNESECSRRQFAYALVYMSLIRSLFSVSIFLTSDSSESVDEKQQQNCLQCALLVLSIFDEVSSSGLSRDTGNTSKFGDIFSLLFWSDVYAAILTLSLEVKKSNIESGSTVIGSYSSSASNRRFLAWPKTTIVRTAEAGIEALLRRPTHPAADLKNVLRLSFALQSAMTSSGLEEKVRRSKEGMLKVLDDYKRFFTKSDSTAAESNFELAFQSHTSVSSEDQFMEGLDFNFDTVFFDYNFDHSTTDFFSLEI